MSAGLNMFRSKRKKVQNTKLRTRSKQQEARKEDSKLHNLEVSVKCSESEKWKAVASLGLAASLPRRAGIGITSIH